MADRFVLFFVRLFEYLDPKEYRYWKKHQNRELDDEEKVRLTIETG